MENEKIKEIYKGKTIQLKIVEGDYGGKHVSKEVVVHPDVIAVLPLIEKDKIVLIRQYRVPAKKELWEIPAGKIEKGETPQDCVKRELEEETGFKAKKYEQIGEFYKSPGYSTAYMYLFKATELEKGKQALTDSEMINKVKVFSLKQALKMIENKKIIDASTIIALMYEMNKFKQK